jgi:hypothetical protein
MGSFGQRQAGESVQGSEMNTQDILALVTEYGYKNTSPTQLLKIKRAIEALQADAARYRWLRSAKPGRSVVCTSTGGAWNAWLNSGELDAAIDAEMKSA